MRWIERVHCRYCSAADEKAGFVLFSILYCDSISMFIRFMLTVVICAWTVNAYAKNSQYSDPEQDDPQPCMPPGTYVARPGDPPFGVYVQTTVLYKQKRYLLG